MPRPPQAAGPRESAQRVQWGAAAAGVRMAQPAVSVASVRDC
jgi:hypothetical protein